MEESKAEVPEVFVISAAVRAGLLAPGPIAQWRSGWVPAAAYGVVSQELAHGFGKASILDLHTYNVTLAGFGLSSRDLAKQSPWHSGV